MNGFEKLTLKDLFLNSVTRFAALPSLSKVSGEPMSYAEFGLQVERVQQVLVHFGVTKGDRVGIFSESMPNWGVAYFAIASMGAVTVPILPDFHPNEVNHIIRDAECKFFFVSRRLFEKVAESEFDTVVCRVLIDGFQILPPDLKEANFEKGITEGGEEFQSIAEKKEGSERLGSIQVEEDDLASIIYTSGTTGHSKGVMLSHKNLVFDAIGGSRTAVINEKDRLLSILPLSHTYECTLGLILPIMVGASIYYIEKPPTAAVLLPAMAKIKPTMILSIPLVIEKIYKTKILPNLMSNAFLRSVYKLPVIRKALHRAAGKKLLSTFGGELRFFGVGGAPMAPDVEKFLREAKFPYAVGYGLTETAPLIAGSSPELTKYRSTGPALAGVEVKIDDPDPETMEGEIIVKGPNIMQGYYKDPERTAEVFTSDGWFKTGDLGLKDEDGYIFIKGRLKNMILGPSGENIYPEEIESRILENDLIVEVIVFQQEGKIVARVHPDYEKLDIDFHQQHLSDTDAEKKIKLLLEDIRKTVNENVSSYSRIHKMIEQRDPFVRTATQKIKRFLYTS